ncbi:MAG: metalloregulator ArsR/SmtB family transcription factor [Chloroflexota bacterium]|nr:metalloregulator ArsR/SmtB family transcription factor [Chloroflexota bacterium]
MKDVFLSQDEKRLLRIFKALSNPIRYRMVRYMVEHPYCITGDLVDFADLAQSTVSQHLKVLREAGIVCGEIEGPARSYCLDLEALEWFRRQVDEMAFELAEAACC